MPGWRGVSFRALLSPSQRLRAWVRNTLCAVVVATIFEHIPIELPVELAHI
jgi:hypothetical protein